MTPVYIHYIKSMNQVRGMIIIEYTILYFSFRNSSYHLSFGVVRVYIYMFSPKGRDILPWVWSCDAPHLLPCYICHVCWNPCGTRLPRSTFADVGELGVGEGASCPYVWSLQGSMRMVKIRDCQGICCSIFLVQDEMRMFFSVVIRYYYDLKDIFNFFQ